MKTFKDLEFKAHPHDVNGRQAKMIFENGYGISVVRFKMYGDFFGSYTNNESEWEIAVLKGNEKNWELDYSTPITEDVCGYLSAEEVTEIMKQIQEL